MRDAYNKFRDLFPAEIEHNHDQKDQEKSLRYALGNERLPF